jgi:hypothetical protein
MNARFLVSQSLLQVSNNHEYHSGQGMPWVLQVCAKTVSKRSKRFFANNGQNSYCCKSHRHVITRLHTHTLYLNKSFALLLWLSLSNHYECTRHQWEFGGCHSGKRSKRSAHAKWFAQRWQVGGMGTHQVSARLASLWKRQMVQDWRRNSHEVSMLHLWNDAGIVLCITPNSENIFPSSSLTSELRFKSRLMLRLYSGEWTRARMFLPS